MAGKHRNEGHTMKKKLLSIVLVLALVVLATACAQAPANNEHTYDADTNGEHLEGVGIDNEHTEDAGIDNEHATYEADTHDEHSYEADIHQVLYALQNPGDWIILDVRSPAEFEGDPTVATERVFGFGRIAGAVNIEWSEAFDDNEQPLPEDELRELYNEVLDGRSIIVYCRSGVRSARTLAVLSDLGVEVLNFSGSWIEWSYTASYGAPPYRELVLAFTEKWTQAE